MENLNLDIRTFVQTFFILSMVGMAWLIWTGIRHIQSARNISFYRRRRERVVRGWRMFFLALLLGALGAGARAYAEPVIYQFFPPTLTPIPTPTITLTPTVSRTPSITLTPSVTNTPSESDTPTPTSTPFIPLAVETLFESVVTPSAASVFSPLVFTQGIDEAYQAVSPGTEFENPVGHLYAVFSYDQMIEGVQWTALWFREGDLVHFETLVWEGGSGGFGYTDWEPRPDLWQPGTYQVQIYTGLILKVSGEFTVLGEAPTPVPGVADPTDAAVVVSQTLQAENATATATRTATPTPSRTPTTIPTMTPTPTITQTPSDTPTPTPSRTRWPTLTPTVPTATITRHPTATNITPSPTITRRPTFTMTPSP